MNIVRVIIFSVLIVCFFFVFRVFKVLLVLLFRLESVNIGLNVYCFWSRVEEIRIESFMVLVFMVLCFLNIVL